MQRFHASASNANVGLVPLVTGGSWKKSPVTTSCEGRRRGKQEGADRDKEIGRT